MNLHFWISWTATTLVHMCFCAGQTAWLHGCKLRPPPLLCCCRGLVLQQQQQYFTSAHGVRSSRCSRCSPRSPARRDRRRTPGLRRLWISFFLFFLFTPFLPRFLCCQAGESLSRWADNLGFYGSPSCVWNINEDGRIHPKNIDQNTIVIAFCQKPNLATCSRETGPAKRPLTWRTHVCVWMLKQMLSYKQPPRPRLEV